MRTKCEKERREPVLRTFLALLERSGVSINMSLLTCLNLLDSGKYLNIYEAVELETQTKGRALNAAVKRRQGRWFDRRQYFETLLEFGRDTHYASLNLGGPGAERYGICCVHLDLESISEYRTCFGSDPLRTVFDTNGVQLLTDRQVLSLFAPHEDLPLLAAVRHSDYVLSSGPSMVESEFRAILEDSDSLIEVHVHGPVLRAHIKRIAMSERTYRQMWQKTLRYERLGSPWKESEEYEAVKLFKKLLELIRTHRLPAPIAV